MFVKYPIFLVWFQLVGDWYFDVGRRGYNVSPQVVCAQV